MCMPQYREARIALRDHAEAIALGWTMAAKARCATCLRQQQLQRAGAGKTAPGLKDALHRELLGAVCARKAAQMASSATRFHYAKVMDELMDQHAARLRRLELEQASRQEQQLELQARLPRKAVFIFDFDDTLMATTYFERTNMFAMSEVPALRRNADKELAMMQMLDRAVVDVLRASAQYGETLIVTNAGAGWVELASSQYLPRLKQFLLDSGIRVISARSSYAHIPIESASEWKVECFSDQLRSLFPAMADVNMLVFGDSIGDQYAAHCSFAKLSGRSLLKFVKFAERPTPSQLVHQLTVLRDNLPSLVSHPASFDVNVTKPTA
uniref:Uncharacterized protein n=1 Tax=Erythrolobus australicus TaxID=1077150 RepID=A0A7S1XIB0_9RHOD|mmetsp:Transcript_2642/g.7214  ORF Transcript_2642/g.7214 Transcript_2642/m.7214 type:complete len:326 (+) Transcript_2642:45-1022(+)